MLKQITQKFKDDTEKDSQSQMDANKYDKIMRSLSVKVNKFFFCHKNKRVSPPPRD